MMWNSHFHALIPRNPIIVRDLYRQQSTTSYQWKFLETVGVVSVALCFAVAMLLCVVYTQDLRYWQDFIVPIQFLAWTFHAAAVLRLLAAGYSGIAQDGYLLGSEDLRVTPLSNWQLFIGKWWAVMHQMRGWLVSLGIVQLGIVTSTGFAQLMRVDWGASCGRPCVVTVYGLFRSSWFTPTRSLSVVVAAIVITLLETVCCATLGMAVALIVRNRLGLIYAIALRFAPVLIFSFFPIYPWGFSDSPLWRYSEYTWFTFADGGTGAIVQMAFPMDVVASSFERGVLALLALISMYFIYLLFSLVTAWAVMRKSRR